MDHRGFVGSRLAGRPSRREHAVRAAALAVALAAAAAFVLALAGGAQAASAKSERRAAPSCASSPGFGGPRISIVTCPAYQAASNGASFSFVVENTFGQPYGIAYKLDANAWRGVGTALTLQGLAPGFHWLGVKLVVGGFDYIAWFNWIVPGPVASIDDVAFGGAGNNNVTVTWSANAGAGITPWRSYCSIDGAPEVICRIPTVVYNGLARGLAHVVTFRTLAGPADPGRTSTLVIDLTSPASPAWVAFTAGAWG